MRKNSTKIFIFFFSIFIFMPLVSSQFFFSTISTCSQLQDIGIELSGNYQLSRDIDCSGTKLWHNKNGFLPIEGIFTGLLDGNGFTIDGLFIDQNGSTATPNAGIFKINNGSILNIILTGVNMTSHSSNFGTITGNNYGLIQNVLVSGFLSSNNSDTVGSIAGRHTDGIITQVKSSIVIDELSGSGSIGGIIGVAGTTVGSGFTPTLTECSNVGDVNGGASNFIGGVIGASNGISVENCYNQGDITSSKGSTSTLGGFIGNHFGTISKSYSSGDVTVYNLTVTETGGFAGRIENGGSISDSFSASDLIILNGNRDKNGSFVGYMNDGLITRSYARNLVSRSIFCIGVDDIGNWQDCNTVEDDFTSYFKRQGNDPMNFWNFNFIWNVNDNNIRFPTLNFETALQLVVPSALECVFPTLFCDNFNYEASMSIVKDWQVRNEDDSLDASFTPRGGVVVFNESNPRKIRHYGFTNFPVNYTRLDGFTITDSIYAPVFSNEFVFFTNTTETNNRVDFKAWDFNNDECFDVRIQGNSSVGPPFVDLAMQLWVRDYTTTGGWFNISNLAPNTSYKVKISSYFTGINKTDIYGFNTSESSSHIHIWVNGSPKHSHLLGEDKHDFVIPTNCDSIKSFEVDKRGDAFSSFVFEDYYMYVGLDKNIDTTQNHISAITPALTTLDVFGNETGEVAVTIDNTWEKIGLKTTASKIIMALVFLFIGTLAFIGGFISAGQNPNVGVIAFIDFLFMILLTYMGLLPIWIIIAVTGFGLLGFVLWVKFSVMSPS